MNPINLDQLIPGSKYFRWHEALWLDTWKVHVFPTDIQYLNVLKSVKKYDQVREYLEQPMAPTSWVRPIIYNNWDKPFGVGGSRLSAHKRGNALDFIVEKIKPDRVRELLAPVLDDFDICMERLPNSNWVHIDCDPPRKNTGRYFVPF